MSCPTTGSWDPCKDWKRNRRRSRTVEDRPGTTGTGAGLNDFTGKKGDGEAESDRSRNTGGNPSGRPTGVEGHRLGLTYTPRRPDQTSTGTRRHRGWTTRWVYPPMHLRKPRNLPSTRRTQEERRRRDLGVTGTRSGKGVVALRFFDTETPCV